MKLALLASQASIHTVRWANALAERGHEVNLLTLHGQEDNPLDGRVRVHLLPHPAPWGYFANAVAVRSLLGRIKPDILHAHYASGYGVLGRLSRYRPFILSVWGSDVYDFPEKSFLHRFLIRSNLKAADWVCSTSEVMAKRTSLLYQEIKHMSVTPFGIDTEAFSPRCGSRNDEGTITIGTVKTLDDRYGVDLLLEVFADSRNKLMMDNPGLARRLRLLIVGGGPDRKKLEGLAFQLDINSCVLFTGAVPYSEVPNYLCRLDVYVALSRSESFGVAVIEASACGLPVIVSDVGGLPEVVTRGRTGFVVERENVREASEALIELIKNPELRMRMGTAGRARVEKCYRWSDNVTLMEDVYKKVTAFERSSR